MKCLVTWADLNYIDAPGSYGFQDGILDLGSDHLEAWERDLEGVWEVGRNPSAGPSRQLGTRTLSSL
jgi:hypothetical protein